jgi:hypothetical protein
MCYPKEDCVLDIVLSLGKESDSHEKFFKVLHSPALLRVEAFPYVLDKVCEVFEMELPRVLALASILEFSSKSEHNTFLQREVKMLILTLLWGLSKPD